MMMSAVETCIMIFVSDAIDTLVWERGFRPIATSCHRRLRAFEDEIWQTLRDAGLKPYAKRYSISPTGAVVYEGDNSDERNAVEEEDCSDEKNAVEEDSSDERKPSEIDILRNCIKSMRKTIYPRILFQIQNWE
jgi:hypothetical protein